MIIIGSVLIIWHLATLYNRTLMDRSVTHASIMVFAIILSALPLLLYGSSHDFTRYLEKLTEPMKGAIVGLACFIIGAVYFLTFSRAEPVFVQMGFMVVLLAFYEVNSISNRFIAHITDKDSSVSGATLIRIMSHQCVMLMAVFVLATGGLYLALMGVLGFRSVWSVLILVSALLMIIAMMARSRSI